eukprot:CAMPEP_0171306612 /NCGR_PEP_ID=MMETSP0816-20121228/16627_1 /TAXON_ID=420281 /ORGANISM="Proboscia inermis, Strain CCAP1064/1" /LENGTH=111 /DNA_ID=CAMNT_0011788289 /DNA_START=365 /DNA_END=701 /DNA_ORIENTATION=-
MIICAHSKPLKISTRVLIAIKDNGLDMRNDVAIEFEIDSAPMLATLLLKVEEETFLRNTPAQINNPNCWIAMIPFPKLDDRGIRVDSKSDITAAITTFDINVAKIKQMQPA